MSEVADFNQNGAIVYRGPSMLDGAPIVVVVTGLSGRSRNVKTGHMIQTWILRDDVAPHAALKTGDDSSVCGDCKHRPANGGACYVQVARAPLTVWQAVQRGRYRTVEAVNQIAWMVEGRAVRIGSYGDPAAVPVAVWRALTTRAASWTGYTHQWQAGAHDDLKPYCMASADNLGEAVLARAKGWLTFRVRLDGDALAPREFVCPASKEAGYKTNCAACTACGGSSAKAKASPVIMAHGPTARRFALYANGAQIAA